MDNQKQIEEMVNVYAQNCSNTPIGECEPKNCMDCIANAFYNAGYRKIPEGAVVLTKEEYQRYERIEKTIKLAKMEKAIGYEVKNGKLYYFSNLLGGCEIKFKDLQEICEMANHYLEEFYGLDQRLTFWKGKAETIGKETAEKFAEMAKEAFFGVNCIDIDEWKWFQDKLDEILKEITEVK